MTPSVRSSALCVMALLLAATQSLAQVDVLTQHNDTARSGANLQETTLNTSNVNNKTFGKLAFRIVDGNIYAQPLIVSQAKIANRTGAPTVAIVATEHNSVYAFDADDVNQNSTTAELWHTGPKVLGTAVTSTEMGAKIGMVPAPCGDLTTEIGITSTPVVHLTKTTAPKEGVVFVVSKSKRPDNAHQYRLFALSLADGTQLGRITIQGEVTGTGTGAQNGKIRFDANIQLNRPALLLHDNILYVAFGGHCDRPAGPNRSYHGWVFAYNVSNPKAPTRVAIFSTTPNARGNALESRAGIWMSGNGPAVADSGSVYLATGDGTYNPAKQDFGNTVLRLKLVGGTLQVQDWYSPQNRDELKIHDADLGAGGAVPLPNSHLVVAGGKEGRLYLIDRNDMGKGARPSLDSFQVTHPKDAHYYNLHGGAVVWPRQGHTFLYVSGEEDPLKQYRLVPDASAAGWKFDSATPRMPFDPLVPFARTLQTAPYPNFPNGLFGDKSRGMPWMPGGFMSLSADGDKEGTGIIWVAMPYANNANQQVTRGVLRAFDAANVSRPQLWESEATGNDINRLGQFAKFCPPTIANGKVYIATFHAEIIRADNVHVKQEGGDQPALAIYGLKQ